MKKALQREFGLVTSTAILEEVSDRLGNKFDMPVEEIKKLLDILLRPVQIMVSYKSAWFEIFTNMGAGIFSYILGLGVL